MSVSRIFYFSLNGPFPSCPKPLFQSEAKCEAIDMKIVFYPHARKTHRHKKGTFCTQPRLESESFWSSEMAYREYKVK